MIRPIPKTTEMFRTMTCLLTLRLSNGGAKTPVRYSRAVDSPLKINEIFYSIQGESLLAGKPSVFIRTATCNLRCTYCDTRHAFWDGKLMHLSEILDEVHRHKTKYVCVTGGE